MLKWKLKKTPIKPFSFSFLKDYLENLGIKETNSFVMEPLPSDEESYENLDNIKEACIELYKSFEENKKIFLQVDSDADGYTSSAIFYGFFKQLYPDAKIEWRLHDGKEHGIFLDTVPIDADVIVIPDAGSMQFDEQEKLSNQGRKVIILDHHNMGEEYPKFENVIIVNNQSSPRFNNKYLSGAGVVYKTIQAFNEYYSGKFPKIYEKFTDLAAVGIIADMMDTRELDNNYIIQRGLKNITNPMLKALLEKQAYSVNNIEAPTKIDIAFYIAPLINGVIRFGTAEEKEILFEGLVNYESDEIIETRYRGVARKENYYDYIARTSANVRARQNREKEKSMNFLKNRIEEKKLYDNQLLIVTTSKDDEVTVPHTITGLVAMELLKEYKRPTLVLRPKSDGNGGTVYAGSGRGKANGDFDSLFGMLRESKLCEFVEGHDMAHGVAIKEENLPKVIEFANNFLENIQFDVTEVEVDFEFHNGNINQEMLREFGKAIHLYGNGIPQPKFAFDLRVAKDAIRIMGKSNDTMKFSVMGVDFLKFKCKDLIEEINESNSHLFNVKVIGRSQINEWRGNETTQIMIDEIEISSIQIEDLF